MPFVTLKRPWLLKILFAGRCREASCLGRTKPANHDVEVPDRWLRCGAGAALPRRRRAGTTPLLFSPSLSHCPSLFPSGDAQPPSSEGRRLFYVAPQVRVLLTKRAASLSSHAGEVAFPGGRVDPTDASETAAALREAHECAVATTAAPLLLQRLASHYTAAAPPHRRAARPLNSLPLREIGLSPSDVETVALFPYAVGQKSLPVRPVVGLIPPDFRPTPSPHEVAAVFNEPLERFLSKDGHTAREIHFKRPAVGLGPGSVRLHSFSCGEHTVFGLTAHFLIQVAKIAYDRDPAFEEQSPGSAARIGTVLLPKPGGTAALDAAEGAGLAAAGAEAASDRRVTTTTTGGLEEWKPAARAAAAFPTYAAGSGGGQLPHGGSMARL